MMTMMMLIYNALTPQSIVIAVVGYIVVFISLVLLFWLFNLLPKLIYYKSAKRSSEIGSKQSQANKMGVEGDTIAAISMALHLYFSELHDEESGVLTIKKVSKAYSPWSSKIYAVRNQFNRR
jgi:glutaconyl-CoA/methylmalonyl-CoA decarboxylase subunit delta